ncbi:MAG: hypothetical protein WC554_09415 [Clostridia bacterium]
MKITEAYFIQHCDFPGCDLGTFEYTCPECGKYVIDYEIWWEENEIWKGKKVHFKCHECRKELFVEWNKKEFKYQVKC